MEPTDLALVTFVIVDLIVITVLTTVVGPRIAARRVRADARTVAEADLSPIIKRELEGTVTGLEAIVKREVQFVRADAEARIKAAQAELEQRALDLQSEKEKASLAARRLGNASAASRIEAAEREQMQELALLEKYGERAEILRAMKPDWWKLIVKAGPGGAAMLERLSKTLQTGGDGQPTLTRERRPEY